MEGEGRKGGERKLRGEKKERKQMEREREREREKSKLDFLTTCTGCQPVVVSRSSQLCHLRKLQVGAGRPPFIA
jgi:hypothetical protein